MSLFADWRDCSRFRSRASEWQHIVFYAETGQDWHHFAPLIAELTGPLDRSVCYVTSDPDDTAFARAGVKLSCHHVPAGWARTLAFKTLQADVCVLTMMDLDNFELGRSAHPVHYVYVFHSLGSTHMVDFANSYDHYDTILCGGPHQQREIQAREVQAGLVPKRLLPHGSARLESLIEAAREVAERPVGTPPTLLVAPTWGPTSLFSSCGPELIQGLLDAGFRVIARPHYETVRQAPQVVEALRARFAGHPRFEYIDQMRDLDTLLRSDLLVTDWSAVAVEYALGLTRPVLFVDVPARVRNPHYRELGLEPLEISLRTRVGDVLPLDALHEAPLRIAKLLSDRSGFAERMTALRSELVFNVGTSARVGARHIARIADDQARQRWAQSRRA